MSFDKFYPNRKDRRRLFRRPKSIDKTCRNHNWCPACRSNRTHSNNKQRIITKEKLKDDYEYQEN